MSSFFYGSHHQQQLHSQPNHQIGQPHPHHGGRSRRAPRYSASQNSHRAFRGQKNVKDVVVEPPNITAFRARFEAGRSFDLDDDLEFCPQLLTFDEVDAPAMGNGHDWSLTFPKRQSITSSSSDRSSLSSGSPESSPLQTQLQPQQMVTPALSLSSAAASSYIPSPAFANSNNNLKIHQPSAVRTRNAIPIVNPSTGMRVASPPSSISPGLMQQTTAARRW